MKFLSLIFTLFTLALPAVLAAQESGVVKEHLKSEKKDPSRADSLINFAKEQIGVKYAYAGSSPETGFDCSGFVSYVFTNFGYEVPRRSRDYVSVGKEVKLKHCKKGDIILFAGYDSKKTPVGHVGIIVDNNEGEITFIHSATSKNRGVVISNYNAVKYYTDRFVSVRRIMY